MFAFQLYEKSSTTYWEVAGEMGKGYKPRALAHKTYSIMISEKWFWWAVYFVPAHKVSDACICSTWYCILLDWKWIGY